jgi:hypothetical protein
MVKSSWELDGSGVARQLDDWTLTEQQRERSSRMVIVAVVLSLLLLGSFLISQLVR